MTIEPGDFEGYPELQTCRVHNARIIYDGTENYKTVIRWCSRCGSIYHPKRKRNGDLTKRCYWQAPRSAARAAGY